MSVLTFLPKGCARSGFEERAKRMQCDQNPAIRLQRVDFCQRLGHRVQRVASPSASWAAPSVTIRTCDVPVKPYGIGPSGDIMPTKASDQHT